MSTTLSSPIQNPHETASIHSTPGLQIPGAYPHIGTTRQRPLSDSRRVSDPTSLPSEETEGAHPGDHCGGAGPLPGTSEESAVAETPYERECEGKAAAGPSSRSKELAADTDRGDDARETVAAAVAPVPEKRASERETDTKSALRSKELAADTGRGDDTREGAIAAAPASSEKPDVTSQDSPVRRTDSQGPDTVGEQAPEARRAETTGTTTSADSKFKEELRRAEKRGDVIDEGQHSPPPPPGTGAAEDLAPQKGDEKDPNKAAAVQPVQQQQEQQSGTAGDQAPQRSSNVNILGRVKGGVKVLMGKASGNREKVEEGERLKRGAQ